MKCQNCGMNNANVRYTQVINGEKTELFLCDGCANEMNIGMNFDFGMNDVFSSFFDGLTGIKTISIPEITKCKSCGLSYDEFSNTGMLGCKDCYNSFSNRLDGILNRIHGSNRHLNLKNKNEVESSAKKEISEIENLKAKLKNCIAKEEYEKAAVLRDKIKKLEK